MFQDAHLITQDTLCLEAHFEGKYRSKITTTDGVLYSELLPRELLNNACLKYGSTLDGRIMAVRELLKYNKKTPFAIIPYCVGAFPTMSPIHADCIWVFNHLFTIEETANRRVSRITFLNGVSILIPTSSHSLSKQQKRLHTLLHTFLTLHQTS